MLIPVALLVYAAWRAWPHLPRAIQRHGLIAATINIPLYLLTCWPGEWRNLSLLYIISLIVLGSCLGEWMSRSKAASVPLSS
jgi:hypothetical protein